MQSLRVLRGQVEEINISTLLNSEDTPESQYSDQTLSASILLQDYYLPAHNLFIAMQHNIIDPLEVARSNIANSLIFLDYPYLTTTILKRGLGVDNPRGFGYAYQYFVEGYNAMGMFGIFYNAIFWNLGIILWTRLIKSNNKQHNKVMISLVAFFMLYAMKGQFATFIKFFWMYLTPALILLLLANNTKIIFVRRKRIQI